MEHVLHACSTRFLTQKTFVILKKRWPNKKLLLARRACSLLFSIGGALISGVPSSVLVRLPLPLLLGNGQWANDRLLSLVLLSLVHMISTLVNRGRTRQKETEQAHQQECTPTEDKTKRHRASTANKRQLADRQGRLGAEPAMKRMCLYCSPEPGHPDRSSRRRRLRHRPRHRRLVPLPLR